MTKDEGTFARPASGLVRSWSAWDGFAYNANSAVGFTTASMVSAFGLLPAFYATPNMSLYLGLGAIIATIGVIPIVLSYVMLGSTMPRAGGDYVWNSRVIHPTLGFIMPNVGITVLTVGYCSVNAIFVLTFIMGFGLANVGQPGLATTLGTVGPLFHFLAILTILVPILWMIGGMRVVGIISRITNIAVWVGLAVTIVALVIGQFTFHSNYNALYGSGAYERVVSTAQNQGWTTGAYGGTIVLLSSVYVAGQLVYSTLSSVHTGEIKGAHRLNVQIKMVLFAMLFGGFAHIIQFFLVPTAFGERFFGAVSYLFQTGKAGSAGSALSPFAGWYIDLSTIAYGPVGYIIAGWIVLISMNMLNTIFYQMWNQYSGVKYVFAGAFDGLYPRKLAYVNPRTHAPILAIVAIAGIAILWYVSAIAAGSGSPFIIFVFIPAFIFGILSYMAITMISAIVLPYRKKMKSVYEAAPASKYKIGGIPAMAVCGVLGLVYILILLFSFVLQPQLAAAALATKSVETVGIVYLSVIVYYLLARLVRARQGINLSRAFIEIPPE